MSRRGWRREPGRHSLAARGIRTKQLFGRKDLYEKARKAVMMARKDKLEHSFTADWDEGQRFKIVEGEPSTYTNDLPDEEREASFHVHPNHEAPTPSPFDVVNAQVNEELWSAVANLDGKFIVFKPNTGTKEYEQFARLTWDAWDKCEGYDSNGMLIIGGDGMEKLQKAQQMLDEDVRSRKGMIVEILWEGDLS